MQVEDDTARVLSLLTLIHRPTAVIEIGSFVGYSAIHIARALPKGGLLKTLESDPELAAVARSNIEQAGLSDRAEVIHTEACAFLECAPAESADMIFIDGEKQAYPDYLKASARVLRWGGLLIADDCYADGTYDHETAESDDARRAINAYNQAVARASGLYSALFNSGHGLMVSVKTFGPALPQRTVGG
jgi:predicted O-methyltransferase YrrM